jgi:hypothetical protein
MRERSSTSLPGAISSPMSPSRWNRMVSTSLRSAAAGLSPGQARHSEPSSGGGGEGPAQAHWPGRGWVGRGRGWRDAEGGRIGVACGWAAARRSAHMSAWACRRGGTLPLSVFRSSICSGVSPVGGGGWGVGGGRARLCEGPLLLRSGAGDGCARLAGRLLGIQVRTAAAAAASRL